MDLSKVSLNGKKVLVGVTGSIAIYKTLEYIRLLKKSGADVRVIMTKSAEKFVTSLTFEAISSNKVLAEETESWANDNNHIAIGEWADLFVIAPCSANTINKLSHGIADNLLTQTFLAYDRLKLIAPAANTRMIQNPMTQVGLKMLESCNCEFIDTQNKLLACNVKGDGAMAEPVDIFWQSARALLKDKYWEDREVIISGGGTIEKIDDVRYISNFSSGKMANSLATVLFLKGANVSLITTRDCSEVSNSIDKVEVNSSDEMLQRILEKKNSLNNCKKPYLFMAAAVSDYIPKSVENGKMKKSSIGDEWSIELKENIDILSSIDKDGLYAIGFKAETDADNAEKYAVNMLNKKALDGVCLNVIDNNTPFGGDENAFSIYTKNKNFIIGQSDKLTVSFKMLDSFKINFFEEINICQNM